MGEKEFFGELQYDSKGILSRLELHSGTGFIPVEEIRGWPITTVYIKNFDSANMNVDEILKRKKQKGSNAFLRGPLYSIENKFSISPEDSDESVKRKMKFHDLFCSVHYLEVKDK